MVMILNEVLAKQNFITKIALNEGDKELPKELKVKIMRIRMAYNKVRKQFDDDTKEFTDQIVTDELKELANKQERTKEEEDRFNELNAKVNQEYQEFLVQKGTEEIKDTIEDSITEDEYSDILDINSGNDVEINGTKLSAPDFLEIFYSLFVA